MFIGFILTMPNKGSWNGKWTGEGNTYFRYREMDKDEAAKVLKGKPVQNFYHNWGDGWGANVEVRRVMAKEKNQLMKKTVGFSGYDWMIDNIIAHGSTRKPGEK